MKKLLKIQLNKLNFRLGRNPKIEAPSDRKKYIPEAYKAAVLISADFELAWAWRFDKSHPNPVQLGIEKAQKTRKSFSRLIALFEQYETPITWATVGHLFLDSCDGKHEEVKRQDYFENDYWKYSEGDWFDADPGTDVHTDPEWYAPDLIQQIVDSRIDHEIGCHTFSHIDCRDQACPKEVFASDIDACIAAAKTKGMKMESFVHPAHTIGNLDTLREKGFTNYRTDDYNKLSYPKYHNGLWQLENTVELAYNPNWSMEYHLYRFKTIIDRAIASGTLACLWFHPSLPADFVDQVLAPLLAYMHQKKDKLWVTTHKNYVEYITQNRDE